MPSARYSSILPRRRRSAMGSAAFQDAVEKPVELLRLAPFDIDRKGLDPDAPFQGQPDPILLRGQQRRAGRARAHHQRRQFGFAIAVMVGEWVAGEQARAGFLGAAEEFLGMPDAGEGYESAAREFAGRGRRQTRA